MSNLQENKLFYTIVEISHLLGLTEASIRSRIYRKQLPTVKFGSRILIPKSFIEKLLNNSSEELIRFYN